MNDIVKIKMTRLATGSPDGRTVRRYEAGHTYDVPADLARVFVDDLKVASYVGRRTTKRNPGERD
jgi:hypothetical protein